MIIVTYSRSNKGIASTISEKCLERIFQCFFPRRRQVKKHKLIESVLGLIKYIILQVPKIGKRYEKTENGLPKPPVKVDAFSYSASPSVERSSQIDAIRTAS